MGCCLIFSDRTLRRDRLVGHLESVFDDLPCVDTVPELVRGLCVEPDMVLVGSDDGSAWIEAVRQVRHLAPLVPVLVVDECPDAGGDPVPSRVSAPATSQHQRATVALRLGARGFLRAGALPDPQRLPGARTPSTELSQREMDVLLGMTQGLSNAEIAAEVGVAEDTVKTHARRLFRKLGAGDRADAVARGFRQGLLH